MPDDGCGIKDQPHWPQSPALDAELARRTANQARTQEANAKHREQRQDGMADAGSAGSSDAAGVGFASRSQILPSAQLKALIERAKGMRHLADCTSGGACAAGCPRRSTEFIETIKIIKRQQILRQHLKIQKSNAPALEPLPFSQPAHMPFNLAPTGAQSVAVVGSFSSGYSSSSVPPQTLPAQPTTSALGNLPAMPVQPQIPQPVLPPVQPFAPPMQQAPMHQQASTEYTQSQYAQGRADAQYVHWSQQPPRAHALPHQTAEQMPSGPFTQEQIKQLQGQIRDFKLLLQRAKSTFGEVGKCPRSKFVPVFMGSAVHDSLPYPYDVIARDRAAEAEEPAVMSNGTMAAVCGHPDSAEAMAKKLVSAGSAFGTCYAPVARATDDDDLQISVKEVTGCLGGHGGNGGPNDLFAFKRHRHAMVEERSAQRSKDLEGIKARRETWEKQCIESGVKATDGEEPRALTASEEFVRKALRLRRFQHQVRAAFSVLRRDKAGGEGAFLSSSWLPRTPKVHGRQVVEGARHALEGRRLQYARTVESAHHLFDTHAETRAASALEHAKDRNAHAARSIEPLRFGADAAARRTAQLVCGGPKAFEENLKQHHIKAKIQQISHSSTSGGESGVVDVDGIVEVTGGGALTAPVRVGQARSGSEAGMSDCGQKNREGSGNNFRLSWNQSRDAIKKYQKAERARRAEKATKRAAEHTAFLRLVMSHAKSFHDRKRMQRKELLRCANAAKAKVERLVEKTHKNEEAEERKRLELLQAGDMEAYAKLVKEKKNERLSYLLRETEQYVERIKAATHAYQENKLKEEQKQQLALAERNREHTKNQGNDTHGDNSSIPPDLRRVPSAGFGAENDTVDDDESVRKLAKPDRSTKQTEPEKEEAIRKQPDMLKGGELKRYQMDGVQWLVSLHMKGLNGILADEMGLGKTIQTIGLLAYLMETKNENGPFLIVVPLSTLSNWANEFQKWAPAIKVLVYHGEKKMRRAMAKRELKDVRHNVVATTYEMVMQDKATLSKVKWQYIIIDEGHRAKNTKSKFTQVLGNAYEAAHRLLLTGTPLQNNLPELWSLFNYLMPGIFESMDSFDTWFNKPFASFVSSSDSGTGRRKGANQDEEQNKIPAELQLSQEEQLIIVKRLHQMLRPFLMRRTKAQVLGQLPSKVEHIVRCSLSAWQKVVYEQILRGEAVASGQVGKTHRANKSLRNQVMQLRKVCNHPFLFLREYSGGLELVRASGKFAVLDRLLPKLQRAGHRVLMFSQMVEVMSLLQHYFDFRGFKFLTLDGSTASCDREMRMAAFNRPDSPHFIFLLSTRAGGLGLNLASADTVILFDSDWNPQMDAQAQDRAHRIGQKRAVRVLRLVANAAIEQKILTRADEKLTLTDLAVETGQFQFGSGRRASSSSDRRARDERMAGLLASRTTAREQVVGTSTTAMDVSIECPMNSDMARGQSPESQGAMSCSSESDDEGAGAVAAPDTEVDDTGAKTRPLPAHASRTPGASYAVVDGTKASKIARDGTTDVDADADAELNKLIANTPRELALYERMDMERIEQERAEAEQTRGIGAAPLPRLITQDEVPAWLEDPGGLKAAARSARARAAEQARALIKAQKAAIGEGGTAGVSPRSSEAINGGTEEVIALLMSAAPVPAVRSRRPVQTFAENADDEELEEALRPLGPDKGTKKRRRKDTGVSDEAGTSSSAGGGNSGGGNAGIDSGDSGDSSHGRGRGRGRGGSRGRGRGRGKRTRKATSDGENEKSAGKAAVKPKRRRKAATTTAEPQVGASGGAKGANDPARQKEFQEEERKCPWDDMVVISKLEAALDEICALRSDDWDGDLCEPFLEVPDRQEYATYYDTIKTPIAIKDIRRRLQQLGYGRSVSKFGADFQLMTQNATVFNQEGSAIYRAAQEMQRVMDEQLANIRSEMSQASGPASGGA
eukprot:g2710.t1